MAHNPFFLKFSDLPTELSLFSLAGAVIMPGVQLPLNFFEPRYLTLVNDALAADHLIGLLQPISTTRMEETPVLHKVGCVGRITSYSETHDGRIVLVLTGICRFQMMREIAGHQGYRRIIPAWERFVVDYHETAGTITDRKGFLTSLKTFCNLRGVEIPWDDITKMADSDLTNLLCVHLPLSPEDKQALLETITVDKRAELLRGLLDMAAAASVLTNEQRH